jgi:hypothetical protein
VDPARGRGGRRARCCGLDGLRAAQGGVFGCFEMVHQGESNFIFELLDDEGAEVGSSLMNEIGQYDASQAVQIPEDGTYLLNVDADGAWTIRVQQ